MPTQPTSPMTIAQFGKAVDPAIRKHFVDRYSQLEPAMPKIFIEENQEDYNEQHQQYTGLASLQPIAQGAAYPTSSPMQAWATTYTPVKYGDSIQITDELQRYDKSSIAKATTASELQAKEVARSIDERGAKVLLNGFNTSYTSLTDNKPLFSTNHSRSDGGTAQSNASSTSIVLSEANLETAMLAGEQVLDERGKIVNVYMDKLIVPPYLRKLALIITKTEQRSGTMDNDLNVYNVAEFEGLYIDNLLVWKYMSSVAGGLDTQWVLQDADVHQLRWLWGVKPEIAKYNENVGFMNDTLVWKVRYEASTGWDDWRGLWSSQGTQLAYSN